jgi:hypothetical protein
MVHDELQRSKRNARWLVQRIERWWSTGGV